MSTKERAERTVSAGVAEEIVSIWSDHGWSCAGRVLTGNLVTLTFERAEGGKSRTARLAGGAFGHSPTSDTDAGAARTRGPSPTPTGATNV